MEKEYALTILLSNPFPDEITIKRIEHILKQPVDWNQVFSISFWERTTFIICKNLLKCHYYWMIPDSLWVVWYSAYMGNAQKNEQLLYHFHLLEREFSKKNITAIPSGGVMLLSTICKNMKDIRLLHDIDFITEKTYLPAIDNILNSFEFQKIYIDDKDPLINKEILHGNEYFYSKYIDSCFINCDFCSGIGDKNELFSFLIKCMECKESAIYKAAQLLLLYLTAEKSWDKSYCAPKVKHFVYSRLIDIQLYQKFYAEMELSSKLKEITTCFHLEEITTDINTALNFFEKGGYLP